MTYATDRDRGIEASAQVDPAPSDHPFLWMAATAGFLVLVTILTLNASQPLMQLLLSEGGPIEIASAAGYLVVVVTLFREASYAFLARHFYFVLVPLVLCMRELDFHVHFTTISVTKSSFYVSSEVPLAEKLVVVAILALIAYGGYRMVRNHARDFLDGLLSFSPVSVAIALAGACAGASKLLDGIGRKFATVGIDLGANVEIVSLVLEEVLELGIPIYLAIAVFAFFPRGKGYAGTFRR